jgi:formate hydrogenlyase subunit 4
MELAAQLKLMIYAVLVANLFIPWGIASALTGQALAVAVGALTVKLAFLGAALAVGETAVAKMRVFRVATFLAVAFTLALVGMLSFVILEAS